MTFMAAFRKVLLKGSERAGRASHDVLAGETSEEGRKIEWSMVEEFSNSRGEEDLVGPVGYSALDLRPEPQVQPRSKGCWKGKVDDGRGGYVRPARHEGPSEVR